MHPQAHFKSCKTIGCKALMPYAATEDFCPRCLETHKAPQTEQAERMSEKYPKYFKSVDHLDEIDVYQIHHLFNIQDPSGAIQHASKKLLLSGVRTGGKSAFDDVREARDTLTRWLQINAQPA